MTSATTPRAERPGYRPFVTTVTGIAELSPHYVRVTLSGDTLSDFAPHGLDQRIKIVVPFDDGTVTDVGFDDETVLAAGSWYARWRELPDERRNPVRTYTVRAIRPERGEIDVDVVRHAAAPGTTLGPAARWIARAGIGDTLVVAGPDVRSPQSHIGIDWHPGDATRVLIAGDETAVPAALGILEALPAGVRADVLLEIPSSADALPVRTSADVRVTWLARDAADAPASSSAPGTPDDASVPGRRLAAALERWAAENPDAYAPALGARERLDDVDVDVDLIWDSPGEAPRRGFYAWLAGERAAIKRMRRHLVTETGIDRTAVAFMGYWRLGRAENA